MLHNILAAVTTMVPLLALFMQFSMGTGMSERHHRHHDTYLVSIALTRALLLVIVFMSLLGLLLSWLCELGVYSANPVVVLAFFCTFVLVTFLLWAAMCRYRVITYEDYMTITPFVGPERTIRYENILRMEWARLSNAAGYQSVRVFYVGEKKPVTILGTLDVEQILMRINRFEVLEN